MLFLLKIYRNGKMCENAKNDTLAFISALLVHNVLQQFFSDMIMLFSIFLFLFLSILDLQNRRAEARRFITMIDQFYDMRCGVVFLAEAMPQNLFTIENKVRNEISWEERIFMDDLKIAGTEAAEALSIISGEEEAFAIARLISRMTEMKTQDYWDDVHRKWNEHKTLDDKRSWK